MCNVVGEAGRAEDECSGIEAVGEAVRENEIGCAEAASRVADIRAGNYAAEHVGNENVRRSRDAVTRIVDRHAPGAVNGIGVAKCSQEHAILIQDSEPARLDGRRGSVSRRQVSNEHNAVGQDPDGRGETGLIRGTRVEGGRVTSRVNPNDGGASSLQVLRIVEIGDQNVARLQNVSGGNGFRRKRNSIRVDVAVARDRRHGGRRERKDALRALSRSKAGCEVKEER